MLNLWIQEGKVRKTKHGEFGFDSREIVGYGSIRYFIKTRNSRKASMVCVEKDIRSMLLKTQKATNTLNMESMPWQWSV